MAPGAVSVVGVLVSGLVAKFTNRTTAGVFMFVVSIIGTIMMFAIPSSQYTSRYGGYVLALQFPNSNPFIMALMTAGVSGSTKKFAFGAAYQLGYAVGNIIGPQTYRSADAPNYYPAKYTMLAFLVFGLFLMASWGVIHKIWNTQRDKRDASEPQDAADVIENEEFLDKTDFNIKSFRYPL
ncbi:putative mfs allantoate transporter protein [Phaeoacremonium minimum UCRPA7]|uniref:Putative mfs allantoate transporter protein n=1 Tax=Phaeoacremonium minimum (strain UCR-PA7) TaxID=1286976 RepID=R8BS29_PHAM7|nr:putative mfs allantoate transporter protein [Phaeoacremonium minimum UCRPA7]EOO02172.1 putative mfs allantoate transporter protein [Phaeoacremonium minimum UCRPA7]